MNKYKIPSAFTLALYLLILAIILALSKSVFYPDILNWQSILAAINNGLWDKGGVVFMVQMVFMLLLGQSLAKTPFFSARITNLFSKTTSARNAYQMVALVSLLACWINWGLGLVLGALAANVAAQALSKKNIVFNYGFLAALGYSGMMLWHNGLSGSSTIKAAEKDAIKTMASQQNVNIPDQVFISETVFSVENILVSLLIILAVWLFARFAKVKEALVNVSLDKDDGQSLKSKNYTATVLGSIILLALLLSTKFDVQLSFLSPNFIISLLLGTLLLFLKDLDVFATHVENNLKSSGGILLQFPIYFAIMAVLTVSGLLNDLSAWALSTLPESALGFGTMVSAAVVNFMVPSGGGQWLLQGPLIIETYANSSIPLSKGILAFAYGDELTNMLQPFWALPLLGITSLKVQDLLPHTFKLFCIGALVYGVAVLFF